MAARKPEAETSTPQRPAIYKILLALGDDELHGYGYGAEMLDAFRRGRRARAGGPRTAERIAIRARRVSGRCEVGLE